MNDSKDKQFFDMDEIDRKLEKKRKFDRRIGLHRRKQNFNPNYVATHIDEYIRDENE